MFLWKECKCQMIWEVNGNVVRVACVCCVKGIVSTK
jgi:hypothetical protein